MMLDEYFDRIKSLYENMDKQYNDIAAHYGLTCEGCRENCCTQRFYHHTFAEYLYLKEGLKKAPPDEVIAILNKARVVTGTYGREVEIGEILPLMCPVNFEGRCLLYGHRPMICRMHGLPHRFTRPDATEARGGGCHRFEAEHKADDRIVDRTWAYMELAYLEKELRIKTNYRVRIKKTTAEMLMDMVQEEPSLQGLFGD